MSQQLPTFSRWSSKIRVWGVDQSFFTIAAWYCLITPFLAAGVALLILYSEGPYDHLKPHPFPNQDQAENIAFFICLSSFVMGLASLFGMRRHGKKYILRKTIPGILASCFFGFCAFVTILGRICRQ